MWLFCLICVKSECISHCISHFSSSLEPSALKSRKSVPIIPWTSRENKYLDSASIWLKAFQFCVYAACHRTARHTASSMCLAGVATANRRCAPPPKVTAKRPFKCQQEVSWGVGQAVMTPQRGEKYRLRHKYKYEWVRRGRPPGRPVFSVINNANSSLPFLMSISVLS